MTLIPLRQPRLQCQQRGDTQKCHSFTSLLLGLALGGSSAIALIPAARPAQISVLLVSAIALLIMVLTERRHHRQTLEQNSAVFRSAVELPLVGIAMTDENTAWLDVNDTFCEIHGYSRQELLNLTWQELTHPDDWASHLEHYQALVAGQIDQYQLDQRSRRKDQQIAYIRVSVGCSRKPDGRFDYAISTVQDISDLKQVEAALKESEARLARTEAFSFVMVVHSELDGQLLKVPPRYCQWLGYTETELRSKTFEAISHPDDFAADWLQCQRLVRGEIKSFDMEKRFIRKDGQILWAYLNCSIVEDATGTPVQLLSYIRDITEQKQAEIAMKRFAAILEATTDIVCISDPQGCPIYSNQAGYRMWNLAADANLSQSHLMSYHPVWARQLITEVALPYAAEHGVWSGETAILNAEGKEVPVSQVLLAHKAPDGSIEFFATIIRDLSEIAKALHNLQQADVRLKSSLREKDVLLKEIHHRVKNNFQIISSLLRLQSRYIQDKQALEIFSEGQRRIRAMALIHEQLYRSQDLARADFAHYIEALANDLLRSHGISFSTVSLQINIRNGLLGIDTAIPCGLIVNELITNALKHAFPDGYSGKISIHLHSTLQDQYLLRVSDNGMGFPADLDFRHTDSLGLNLVCSLVAQLQGTIDLDRTHGSSFKITFQDVKRPEEA